MDTEESEFNYDDIDWQLEDSKTNIQYKNIIHHPLMNIDNLWCLYNLSLRTSSIIDSKFQGKKQVIIGLGQSPAYLLEFLRLLGTVEMRNDREYINVAFSGNFYFDDKINIPLKTNFDKFSHYYQNYLESIGLGDLSDPNTNYILLEMCAQCYGLRSFLSFFKDKESLYTVIYDLYGVKHIDIENSFEIKIDKKEQILIEKLGVADEFKDRLVPRFQYYDWKTVDPNHFIPDKNAEIILSKISNFVADIYEE